MKLGINVTCNYYFLSFQPADKLKKLEISLVGRVRKNRQDLPPGIDINNEIYTTKVYRNKIRHIPTNNQQSIAAHLLFDVVIEQTSRTQLAKRHIPLSAANGYVFYFKSSRSHCNFPTSLSYDKIKVLPEIEGEVVAGYKKDFTQIQIECNTLMRMTTVEPQKIPDGGEGKEQCILNCLVDQLLLQKIVSVGSFNQDPLKNLFTRGDECVDDGCGMVEEGVTDGETGNKVLEGDNFNVSRK
ncbi:hypothetical protein J437_LFUL018755 [Ladona fulva]|uniref:Uncharacterized protein n=1 Tax=Ladona fulva TaxID=123851 RepID=A0A8K0KPX2_LADFU|nr:hypothetical protein J437_LFUL018755 [Ladona fulva]